MPSFLSGRYPAVKVRKKLYVTGMRGSEVVRHVRKETGLVGRNVESLRKAQGLSKTCLSAMAGVCRQELAKVEKGEVNATLGTLIRLADALDVAVGDLFAEPMGE